MHSRRVTADVADLIDRNVREVLYMYLCDGAPGKVNMKATAFPGSFMDETATTVL